MPQPLTDAINALTTYANSVTGASDTTLSDAVATLASGYGGGGYSFADIAEGREPSGTVDISGLTVAQGAFAYSPAITRVIGNNVKLKTSAFANSTGVQTVNVQEITEAGNDIFRNCQNLQYAVVKMTVNGGIGLFHTTGNLEIADLNMPMLRSNTFYISHKLTTIILRSPTVTTLENVGVLNSPNHFKSGGTGGEIYVPQALLATYPTANANWITVNGYGTITWKKIEGSYYETHYADGTPIE